MIHDLSNIANLDRRELISYVDSLREAALLFSDEGFIIHANPTCITHFGYALGELLTHPPAFLFSETLAASLQRYFETGHFSNRESKKFYGRAIRFNKSTFPIEMSLAICITGRENLIMATIRKAEEPKEARDKIRLERALFEELFETSPEAIVILDDNHNILRVNSAFTELFGYRGDDVFGSPIDRLIAKANYYDEASRLTDAVISGNHIARETIRFHKDGYPIHVSILGSPIMLDGLMIGVVGIYRDITARKETEERMRILARFPDESPDPILRISREGIILYANRASEPLMKHWERQITQYLPEEVSYVIRQVIANGEKADLELEIERSVYSLRFSPISTENYVNIYGLDITARKAAEREIEILAKFPAENPDPVIRLTDDGKILYANNASFQLLSYWDTRMGGAIPAEMHRRIKQAIEQNSLTDLEIPCGERFYSLRISPVKSAGYINLYGLDITERKRYEREQKELRDQLVRAERMESLGLLAGGVAHDLNNVLGPLVAYPELIKMQLPPDSPIRDRINKIESSALRAAEMVQDLLTMARRGRYEMVAVNLNSVVDNYLKSTEFENLKGINPKVDCRYLPGKDIPKIKGSASHLSKVVMNLVMNSFDAMPDGGSLEIRTECRRLDSLVGGFDNIEAGQYVVMKVIDSGVGINRQDYKRLFEPFYSKKEMGRSGSGLGLAIVYGVVKDHNGYVDVISEPGQGTEFVVYFPVAPDVVQSDESSSLPSDIHGHEKILVIDDFEEQRELASTILSSLGYRVAISPNGHAGLEFIKNYPVDLVVIDMIMEEGFDGLDTFRAILNIYPNQKAIIVSGYSETIRVREAEKLGAGYVKKPYTMQKLGKAIREMLDKK